MLRAEWFALNAQLAESNDLSSWYCQPLPLYDISFMVLMEEQKLTRVLVKEESSSIHEHS